MSDLTKFGGRMVAQGIAGATWNFGYIPHDERNDEQKAVDEEAKSHMPKFAIAGTYDDADKAFLWEAAKKMNGGNHFNALRQVTGSCVGQGGGNAIWYLMAVQAAKGDAIEVKLPFLLYPYGRSRFRMNGNRCSQGEGSFGSAMAAAVREDGVIPFDFEGLPKPNTDDGISWGQTNEMQWSSGCYASQAVKDAAKQFLVKTTAQVNSANDVKAALINGYPCTIASDWGGLMSPPVQNGVLLNRRADTWQHQMLLLSYWKHPELGEIFYILNSWGPRTHGIDPAGGPPGGFWVKKADVDYITAQGDSFAFSSFDGFPAQKMDWMM